MPTCPATRSSSCAAGKLKLPASTWWRSASTTGTGFSSRSSTPLPYDAVRETQVQFAPFDVDYSSFTGCAINVVTKSGTNEFHGSAFFEYRDENLRGDTAGGEEFIPAEFDEKRRNLHASDCSP